MSCKNCDCDHKKDDSVLGRDETPLMYDGVQPPDWLDNPLREQAAQFREEVPRMFEVLQTLDEVLDEAELGTAERFVLDTFRLRLTKFVADVAIAFDIGIPLDVLETIEDQ